MVIDMSRRDSCLRQLGLITLIEQRGELSVTAVAAELESSIRTLYRDLSVAFGLDNNQMRTSYAAGNQSTDRVESPVSTAAYPLGVARVAPQRHSAAALFIVKSSAARR